MTNYTYLELKKANKMSNMTKSNNSVVLMGDCATQHLATAISGYCSKNNLSIDLTDIDYNLIDEQILNSGSELNSIKPKFTIIIMCSEKLEQQYFETKVKEEFAQNVFKKIKNNWDIINSKFSTNILQSTFIENDNSVFGNFALKAEESFLFQVKKLNYLLACECQKQKNIFLIDINNIQIKEGQQKVKNDKLYYMAKMPFSLEIIPEVAKQIFDCMSSILGRFKKCVICDLDNTLWGGIIGDDGINGIQIGELGQGHAFEDIQRWLKLLKERGIILGVCSKNDDYNAKEPFLKHPDMILRLEDFSIFVANWEDKASNLKYIQKTLNIGMDSIVFLDDNLFERNCVKSIIQDITVPELPEDPALYLAYLKSLNLFEIATFSEADKIHTEQYRADVGRQETEKQFETYEDYLNSLEMSAIASDFDEYQIPRIAQLSQRSNQFNLRTIRMTEKEVDEISKSNDYFTRYFDLKDKFGDCGLISVVVLKKADAKTLFIDNWFMSCRVLKRGMEEFIINEIVELASNNGYDYVVGQYVPTLKNSMVSELYPRLGFQEIGENMYQIKVNDYVIHKTFIKKDKE